MSNGAVNFNEAAVDYYTPKSIVDLFGEFDYDPATTAEQAKRLCIPNYDTIDTDGLKADWTKYKRIWINPPFNIKHSFWEKACETYFKCRNEIYFLCPIAFLTTKRFHESLDKRELNAHIALPEGRINLISDVGQSKNSTAFGSIVVTPTGDMEGKIWRMKLPCV